MARRFVRVDLSPAARDFRPVALEPGVPTLDSANVNGRIVFKWLKGLAAEPEWEEDESVDFYARDDQGGRLEERVCQPASEEDLKGPLAADLETVKKRLAEAKPENSTERILLAVLRRDFRELVEDEHRTDRANYFFRYRDVLGRLRLVWCWGYQRIDQQPAPTVVCAEQECNLLFVRRPGESPKCPACEAALPIKPKRPRRRLPVVWILLLLLLAAVAAWLYLDRHRLIVEPGDWTGPAGSRIAFEVKRPGLFGFAEKDVSAVAVAVADDPRVLRFDRSGSEAVAAAAGTSLVRFNYGKREATVRVTVHQPDVPEQIATEPAPVDLPRTDQPVEVRVLSDQGPSVRFSVGARFDDFRIEAEYQDGFVQMVTKKATMRMEDGSLQGPVSFADGQMIGLTAGTTSVEAEFDGVASAGGLGVTVTARVEIDELRLAPASVRLLPGESVALEAIGYQDGKSVGKITGLGGIHWTADNDRVVQISGPVATGVGLGQSMVTARFDNVTSAAAVVDVVGSIDDALVVDQDAIRMYVGESRRIGVDLSVFRGDIDFSRMAEVTSILAGVVRYDPVTHALVGVSPGVAPVTFAWGDKLAGVTVRVLPIEAVEGDVVIEPAGGILSPAQALDLRVYLVTRDGLRLDSTSSAVLSSSSPAIVSIRGNLACALQPGAAEVTAVLPGARTTGHSLVTVNNEPIAELAVDPSRLAMSTGDTARLRILGRSASGTHLLFPQSQLTLSAEGPDPGAIQLVGGSEIHAVRAGVAEVAVGYRGLSRRVPVSVGDNPWTQLTIEPARATIHPGEAIVYQVTGVRGGRRRVVQPGAGLRLYMTDPAVAHAADGAVVVGDNPGSTSVVARLGGASAEAVLNVVHGSSVVTDPITVTGPGRTTILRPGYGRHGYEYIFGDRPGYVVEHGGPFDGLTTVAPVRVGSLELTLEPADVSIQVGQSTPPMVALARDSGGVPYPVSATMESMDPTVLVPGSAGRFVAQSPGATQVRASYQGREAFAAVTVTGRRFLNVETTLNSGTSDFSVTIEVLAAGSEGPLEYRVYPQGALPPPAWSPAEAYGDHQRVVLGSSQIPYADRAARYSLVLESRSRADGSVQRYPFTFRLESRIVEETTRP